MNSSAGIESSSLEATSPKIRCDRLPSPFRPQLATATSQTPGGDDWLHELKFDGYRLICRIDEGTARLVTRRGNDWTDRFPAVARAIDALALRRSIIDGEVVVLGKRGRTDFQALQNLMRRGNDRDVVYYAFDLPFLDGYDLTGVALAERKGLLAQVINSTADGKLRYSDHIVGNGQEVFAQACRRGLEGIISKRADSPYRQRRTADWLKSKCLMRQEFVIGGWSEPNGSRQAFGSLLLGYHDGGRLVYCGRVGTGFTGESLRDIKRKLDDLATEGSPFDDSPSGREARAVHWVRPRLVAEVRFASWTDDKRLRQASFQGLREDKPAGQVTREDHSRSADGADERVDSRSQGDPSSSNRVARVAGVRLTSPGRVMYPERGITKRELAEFQVAIADRILPHVVGRPLTLVRCPKGRDRKCFYQKHLTESMPDRLRGVVVEEKGKRETYLVVDDLPGLISLVQMSALELHPWPARADRLDRPDRLVFDLDPGEGIEWSDLTRAARDVRDRLEDLGLTSFPRTSGGKGLHVVLPIDRRTPWDELKRFAKSVADALSADAPDRYVATVTKSRRRGKIFIDYLRNQRGATSIASYSTRARPGAPVATPLAWDELSRVTADKYGVKNLRSRLASLGADPWESFFDVRQSITKRMLK